MTSILAPRYRLETIQARIREGRYAITRSAAEGAGTLYLDEDDIKESILGLEDRHFFKSMPSRTRPGMAQDVYRFRCFGFALYAKLQLGIGGTAVVISFKRDECA